LRRVIEKYLECHYYSELMNPKVSLAKSKDHYNGVQSSLELLKDDMKRSFSALSSLLIKINLVITKTPAYSEGVELATTPFLAVKSFIDFISPFYKGKIIIAEEAAWGDTEEGFKLYGFTQLAEENTQVNLLNMEEDDLVEKEIPHSGGKLTLPFSKTMMEAPFIVSITRPKTHCSVGVTLGIKNVTVGAINGYSMRRKIHGEPIHETIAALAAYVYPDFVVLDGTCGMEGGGPVRGTRRDAGWTLASCHALAADSLATYLMGFDSTKVQYLNLLREKEGGLYPEDTIEICGEDPQKLITPFNPHRNFKFLKM
jgi:uncharacterized protein (DUF362 family)